MRNLYGTAVAVLSALAVAAAPATARASVAQTPSATWQTNGSVYAIAVDARGVTYVGGDFTAVRPAGACASCDAVARHGLAAFDRAGHVLPFDPDVDGTVYALAISTANRTVIAGGDFAHANGGVSRRNLAAFRRSGALGPWQPQPNAMVRALAVTPGRLYVGGRFAHISGRGRARVAGYALRRGHSPRLLHTFRPRFDHVVFALALARDHSRRLFVAGSFRHADGRPRRFLTSVSRMNGQLTRWRARPRYRIIALAAARRTLYAGQGGPVGGALLAYATAAGARRWTIRADGDVQALATVRGEVYAGGHFQNVCGGAGTGHGRPFVCDDPVRRRKLFSVHAARAAGIPSRAASGLSAWNPGANSAQGVRAIRAARASIYAGGDFTLIGGRPQQGFARFR